MPAVILYASLTRSHCRAEVARWREVTAGHPDALRDIQLVVVVSASRPDLSWLPGELPFRGVIDTDGGIAASIGLRAVPTAVYADAMGNVRSIRVGETDVESIMSELKHLAGAAG